MSPSRSLGGRREGRTGPGLTRGRSISTTRVDRFSLTTEFLAYARDRLFGTVSDAEGREAELTERFSAELREHDDLHIGEVAAPDPARAAEEQKGG